MTENVDAVHQSVREHYAAQAKASSSCCGSDACCESSSDKLYPVELLTELPQDITSFSLGCGDPITLAELQPGQTVLDLGSGGGLDCFLAARKVGQTGHVIGIDMTPEMIARAKASAERLNLANVEFRQGYLEELPIESSTVDVAISNCVINLAPDKGKVLSEVFRVLKPGGKMAVSDIVTDGVLPEEIRKSMEAWAGCIAGALDVRDYKAALVAAGFTGIEITPTFFDDATLEEAVRDMANEVDMRSISRDQIAKAVFSARITARKP
jgi:ubiquinone/menaquinone biosynthesis C-methylase UbiE